MDRRDFLENIGLIAAGLYLPSELIAGSRPVPPKDFSSKLKPVGRALELEGYYVWCSSPIDGDDGKVHIFFSRWSSSKGMGGWIRGSEIAHAVADTPESPFTVVGTVLAPRPGYWDATTCHNPLIVRESGKYYLFYMGNSNGKTDTKRIGLAVSDSLYGPWERPDAPLLDAGSEGSWDDHCTTNPGFIRHPNGKYCLYYKSWNTKEYQQGTGAIRGNRKYGVAFADSPEGPYTKYDGNPVIDFSSRGNNCQFEDAFIWREKRKFRIIARDMGFYNHENGLLMQSRDGMKWTPPEIAYEGLGKYVSLPPTPSHLKKYGRLERPMLLIRKNKPAYLFGAAQGGRYNTSSTFIFRIEHD